MVNEIRSRVKAWRERGYPATTRVTQKLLRYWSGPDRERKLFYCQREAAETIIWLIEAPATERMGLEISVEVPSNEAALRLSSTTEKEVLACLRLQAFRGAVP